MDLSMLTTAPGARKARKRVGRGPGSGSGKTSARGHKGQRARSGYSQRPGFEGGQMPLNRRMPKRGFYHRDRHPFALVNLEQLDKAFDAGAEVTMATVAATGLVRPLAGGLKVLARGEITKGLTLKVEAISAAARAKVEAAGGKVEVLGPKAQGGEEN